MSNVLYEDRMYNESIKKEFYSQYQEGTQKILKRIFKISCPVEENYNKDLFDFTREELRRFFFLFSPKTEYSSRANVAWVSKYIDWAIEKNYTSGPNPLYRISNEWAEQFTLRSIKKLWTEEEINNIVSKLVNAQDAVIVLLLFSGVRGEDNAEITRLKQSDIDFENCVLTLTNKDWSQRRIKVSEQCIYYCEKAIKQKEYDKSNGNPSADVKSETVPLVENEYVVRSARTKLKYTNEADGNIVYRRLRLISSQFEGLELFNPTNIFNSGMLAMAKQLYDQNGKLDEEEYQQIFEQFNEKSVSSQNRIKREFLNLETLKMIYNIP